MNNYLDLFVETMKSRSELKDRDSRILIIDGLNMWIRTWSAIPVLSSSGQHVGAVAGYLKSIGSVIRQFEPTRCIIAFDGKGGSLRRRKLFSEYKSNRTPKDTWKKEFSSTEEERESMKMQIARTLEYIENLPLTFVRIDHIEADDTIANIAKQYYDEDTKITIVSTDRDFLQLVDDNISIWNPIRKIHYTSKQMEEEYGMLPQNYLLYRILTGDNSDNIPGISGLGLKTLLKEYPFSDTKMNLEDFIELTVRKSNEKKPKKFVQSILTNLPALELNSKLMQLGNVDISLYSKNQIRDHLDIKIPRLNKYQVMKLAHEDGLLSGNWNVENWIHNTFDELDIWANA